MSLAEAQALNPSLAPLLAVVYADFQAAVDDAIDALEARVAALEAQLGGTGDLTLASLTVGDIVITGILQHSGNVIGYFGTSAITKHTINGSRGGNVALADLLANLAAYGLLADASTA